MKVPLPFHPRRLLSLLLLPPAAFAAEPGGLQAVEKAASEWVKTRSETVRLESEWASEQVILSSTIHGLKERAQSLEEKQEQLKARTAEERAELEALAQKRTAAVDELQHVEERLKTLSTELITLRSTLPPRLSDALEMSFRSLENPDLSVSERMQLTMTVLNRCAQFNRDISQGDEVLTLDGEPGPKSLEVIYWGLSHGYALDRAAGKAWFGSPVSNRWQWQPQPEATAGIATLIDIHADKADPTFVNVPAHVKKTFATTSNQ